MHYHQGIDLSVPDHDSKKPPNVISVTDGRVVLVKEWDQESTGYGTYVCIYNERLGYTFLYAHLASVDRDIHVGAEVWEHTVIGKVGNSGRAGAPHLHFEVLKKKGGPRGGIADERVLGEPRRNAAGEIDELRQDPLAVLEALGPWGTRQLYYPLGEVVTADSRDSLHEVVEARDGGFFPLGVNNFWHGGVHLPAAPGSIVRAPLDGTIVAVRLGATPRTAEADYGSLNFILLRHVIPESAWERMQGRKPKSADASSSSPPAPDALKQRRIGPVASAENNPDDVLRVKQRLHELGHYNPSHPSALTSGKFDGALRKAIKDYQSTFDAPPRKAHWPSGVIDIEDETWNRLFPEDVAAAEPEESPSEPPASGSKTPAVDEATRKRTVYILLMHLGPWSIEDALRKKIPRLSSENEPSGKAEFIQWPTRVASRFASPSPAKTEETDESPDDHPADDPDTQDRQEATSHALTGDVSLEQGSEPDIRWIEARLIRFGMFDSRTTPTGRADAELDAAIKRFQQEVAWPGKPKYWDGVVQRGGKTHRALQQTRSEREKASTPAKSSQERSAASAEPEPQLAEEIARTDARGHARVVAGLDLPVREGEPLWHSGATKTPRDDSETPLTEGEVHFEIFSEERLFPDWDTIDDPDDDLLVDAPKTVIDHLDARGDERVPFTEIAGFYKTLPALMLRWTVCRFRSEWDPDLPRIVQRLRELELETDEVESRLRPYAWWQQARESLFDGADSHVWHYNPIQFLSAYQEILGEGGGAAVTASTKGSLLVVVEANNGRPPAEPMTVEVIQGQAKSSKEMGKSGKVLFEDLEPGHYEVHLEGMGAEWVPATIFAQERTTLSLEVDRAGQAPPKVKLHVVVRTSGGMHATGSLVTLRGEGLAKPITEKGGRVQFADVPEGTYDLAVEYSGGSKDPNDRVEWHDTIEVSAAHPRVSVKLPPAACDLTIVHESAAAYVPGTLTPKTEGGAPIPFLTGPAGLAEMRVPRGKYRLVMDSTQKNVTVYLPRQKVSG